jgi:hypothetical protein
LRVAGGIRAPLMMLTTPPCRRGLSAGPGSPPGHRPRGAEHRTAAAVRWRHQRNGGGDEILHSNPRASIGRLSVGGPVVDSETAAPPLETEHEQHERRPISVCRTARPWPEHSGHGREGVMRTNRVTGSGQHRRCCAAESGCDPPRHPIHGCPRAAPGSTAGAGG